MCPCQYRGPTCPRCRGRQEEDDPRQRQRDAAYDRQREQDQRNVDYAYGGPDTCDWK